MALATPFDVYPLPRASQSHDRTRRVPVGSSVVADAPGSHCQLPNLGGVVRVQAESFQRREGCVFQPFEEAETFEPKHDDEPRLGCRSWRRFRSAGPTTNPQAVWGVGGLFVSGCSFGVLAMGQRRARTVEAYPVRQIGALDGQINSEDGRCR